MPYSTWSEAQRHWRAQAKASTPTRRRRRHAHRIDVVQWLLDLQRGGNPWVTLGGAFLAWGTVVFLTLSLLEVIQL
ncbi:hypothetical protein QWZ14_15805 [Paeniroseomonas aquatica]|uniref:Uncharacterized protein n=2 Tax=Paeniroseomonas aquatica TaxID=373043 RepID=A0ABT8A800_9PROT|nr:hypothetical protein [Paeniroseomonas aquatica]MDN3565834.1 hypothetical protein [Paeniroseomonas aquatica]